MDKYSKDKAMPATCPLRVLIVEDQPADAELVVATLKHAGYALSFEIVDTLAQFQAQIHSFSFEVILCDHNLGTWNGMDVLHCLRKSGKEIPFIVVTAALGDEAAVEYIKQGAADYVLKHRLERLPDVVSRALRDKAQRDEMTRLQGEILAGKREWELTFDCVPDAVFLLDKDNLIRRANRAATKVLGLDFNQMIGRPCHEVIHASPDPCSDCPHRMVETAKQAEGDVDLPHLGKTFSFSCAPMRGATGDVSQCVIVMRDITARKRAEEALQTSQEHLAYAQEVVQLASWESDLMGSTMHWSDAVYPILGVSKGDFGGTREDFLNLLLPDDREKVNRALSSGIDNEQPYEVEYRIKRRSDGTLRYLSAKAKIIHNEKGEAVRLIGTVQDITERRLLEEQLLHAQKMEAIGRLAGGVAHDFNNLLTVINGYCDVLLGSVGSDPHVGVQLEEIRKAGERAATLTRQLLAFSRRQVLDPKVLGLNAVISNMEKMLRRLIGEDIELVAIERPDLGNIQADPGQIEQVVMNLAVNARDAMPAGGKLTLETANVEINEAYAQTHFTVVPGSYVMLAVSDTGCGMDEEARRHIFEPFFTTKEKGKGTGLGLATVYGIVKQSRGSIWLYSESGKGTTFKIYFPRVEGEAELPEASRVSSTPQSSNETVLLVEDEAALRTLARQVLEAKGYDVLEARSGEDALVICKQHKGPIHLLLTDVVMPVMGGLELAEAIVGFHRKIKILFMSGYTDDAIVHHGILYPGADFLQKPFSPATLAQKVRQVLGE